MESVRTPREYIDDPDFLSSEHSCLVGEKGVGKTILACQKALRLGRDKVLYVSLDDTLFAGDTMFSIAKAAADRGLALIVFDEVHRYPDWKHDLKSIADRLAIKTIISGSSILSFANLGGLARRMVKYELPGLSLREWINIQYGTALPGVPLERLVRDSRDVIRSIKVGVEQTTGTTTTRLFDEYLRRGYYAYGLKPQSLNDFLRSLRQATEDTIAYEIVVNQTHSRPDMSRKLQALFKIIAQSVPYTIDYQALKESVHIADLRTLKHYLASLQQAGVIATVDRKSLKNLRKPEKLHFGEHLIVLRVRRPSSEHGVASRDILSQLPASIEPGCSRSQQTRRLRG